MMNLLEHALESVENAAENVVDKVEDVLGMDTDKKEDSKADEVGPEIPQEIPQETPETQEPSLLERFEEAVGLKKPEDVAEQVQQEADKANRSLEQPSVSSNILQGQTQPSRVVYAHPGSFQQGNQIQAPQGSGFARYVAHAHAPVQYAQPAPTASLPSSRFSSVPVASQAHAPVQYAQPLPVVAQAPVKQTS